MTFNKSRLLTKLMTLMVLILAVVCLYQKGRLVRPIFAQGNSPTVINKTDALKVVDLKDGERIITLTVKNISDKPITGYVISTPGFGLRSDSLDSLDDDALIAPGQTEVITMGRPANLDTITIEAVIFGDNTNEGNQKSITSFNDWRSGKKVWLQRISEKINEALNSPDVETPVALERLMRDIDAESGQDPTGKHSSTFSLAKKQILDGLLAHKQQKAEKKSTSNYEKLAELRSKLEKAISKL